jgi:hypothetical protein
MHSYENSRPYAEKQVVSHRAGFILKGFTLKGIQPCRQDISIVSLLN